MLFKKKNVLRCQCFKYLLHWCAEAENVKGLLKKNINVNRKVAPYQIFVLSKHVIQINFKKNHFNQKIQTFESVKINLKTA